LLVVSTGTLLLGFDAAFAKYTLVVLFMTSAASVCFMVNIDVLNLVTFYLYFITENHDREKEFGRKDPSAKATIRYLENFSGCEE